MLSFVVWVACIGYCANNPQSTACWPLSSHQHCFSYLLSKWCFLVPKNSFTEYFSRFLFSSTLSLYALNLRPKSPQKTLLLVQFFLLSWKEEKYVGEKFFLTYDCIMITTGICPKTFAPIYPHYKSFDSYIKPQPWSKNYNEVLCCISFDSYIKPQLCTTSTFLAPVVYLLIPTSNHNYRNSFSKRYYVVYLLIPTSNHNSSGRIISPKRLYIFWFLHQTTTDLLRYSLSSCCISFDSYIKPQHSIRLARLVSVVYLLIPTSNHNLLLMILLRTSVVYLLIPTSNHNVSTVSS